MAQMMKAIDAGPLHMEVLYPRLSVRDSDRVRAEKRKSTNAARRALNQTWSARRLAFLMALNFSPGDPVLLFTFDDAHLPPDRAGVLRAFRSFCDRLERVRAKQGAPLLVLFRDEHRHGDGRWHLHALMNGAGEDLEFIQHMWGRGRVFCKPFRMQRHENALSLAKYFTKERRDRLGQKGWGKRGPLVLRYEVQTWTVPDEAALSLPAGALKLEGDGHSDEYGKYEFLFYMDKSGAARRKRRPPRRRDQGEKPRLSLN